MIRVTCPGCDKKLTVNDSYAGKVGKCPGCNAKIQHPRRAAAPHVPWPGVRGG